MSGLQQKIDSLQQAEKLPGIFIGISDSGKRSFLTAGYADPQNKIEFDSSFIFEAGSITKTFTAYILRSVLSDRNISDTVSIINWLPDSVRANRSLAHISFKDLLTHTSGLPRIPDNGDLESLQPYENYTEGLLFSFLRKTDPKPNALFSYSNVGFGLAGVLASRISGRSYDQLLNEKIFMPFGVEPANEKSKKSIGHMQSSPAEYWKFDALAGAGSLKINTDQLLNYLDKMIDPVNDTSKTIINSLLQQQITLGQSNGAGLAWQIMKTNKDTIYWHNGGTYGFSTFAAFNRSSKKSVVVVINEFNKNQLSDGLGVFIMRNF